MMERNEWLLAWAHPEASDSAGLAGTWVVQSVQHVSHSSLNTVTSFRGPYFWTAVWSVPSNTVLFSVEL